MLVADDNSNIQKAVVTALKDHGIEVLTVGNGEAAVRKLTDSRPDLILADIFMPVRNGYEVCEYVKKDDRYAHIPVVLLVGAFDPLDEHEVERVRADGVLKKPFVPPDPLVQLVKSFLEKAALSAGRPGMAPEDIDQTQDEVPGGGHIPTGTVKIPMPNFPPVEKTQRLEPEVLSGAGVSAPEKTQRLETADNFELGLSEPKPAPQMEKTQQLNAQDISKIIQRPSPFAAPAPPQEEIEEYGARPAAIELGPGESPLAFGDLLGTPEEETLEHEEAEEPEEAERPAFGGFATDEEHGEEHEEEAVAEGPSEAEVHFGGIREESKTPDPERGPIPVVFDRSEPMELITDEHVEKSRMEIGPAENLVSSSSGWASAEAHGITHPAAGREPELLPEGAGAEGFMSAPLPGPAPAAPAAQDFAVPSPEEFEETAKLNAGILQEEVNRAQEIAARIAAQNREALATEALESAAPASLAGPGIDRAISAVDDMLARHRPHGGETETPAEIPSRIGTGTEQIPATEMAGFAPPPAAAAAAASRIGTGTEQIPMAEVSAAAAPAQFEPPSPRMGTGTEQMSVAEFGGIAGAAVAGSVPAPPAQTEGRAGTGTLQLPAEEIAAQARAAAGNQEMIEAVSERVLAQLDPYLIEKISKEIVKPIVEAILKRELEKLQ